MIVSVLRTFEDSREVDVYFVDTSKLDMEDCEQANLMSYIDEGGGDIRHPVGFGSSLVQPPCMVDKHVWINEL